MFSLKDPKVMSLLTHTNFVFGSTYTFCLVHEFTQGEDGETGADGLPGDVVGEGDPGDVGHKGPLGSPGRPVCSPFPFANLPFSTLQSPNISSRPLLFLALSSLPLSLSLSNLPLSTKTGNLPISLFSTTNPLISLQSPPSILHLSLTPTGFTR